MLKHVAKRSFSVGVTFQGRGIFLDFSEASAGGCGGSGCGLFWPRSDLVALDNGCPASGQSGGFLEFSGAFSERWYGGPSHEEFRGFW